MKLTRSTYARVEVTIRAGRTVLYLCGRRITCIHEGVKVNDDIEQMFSERSITKYMNTKLNL